MIKKKPEHHIVGQRTVRGIADRITGAAQRDHLAVVQRHRQVGISDLHLPLGLQPLHGEILQLRAIGRFRDDVERVAVQQCLLGFVPGWHGQPEEHRDRALPSVAVRRVPAPILEVAVLAAARIEQGTQPVRCLGRGRRTDPGLAEQGVAELEPLFLLEAQIGKAEREDVLVDQLPDGAGARLHRLEVLRRGEIGCRCGDAADPLEVLGRKVRPHARLLRRCEAGGKRDDQGCCQ